MPRRARIRRGAPLTPPGLAGHTAIDFQREIARDVACVVVHHDSLDSLGPTLSSLVVAGVSAETLIVVDNSGESCTSAELEHVLPHGARLIRMQNRGFAAAVNVGIEAVSAARVARAPYALLVCTHEVLLEPDCVARLLADLVDDPGLGVVGPLLSTPEGQVWSAGGLLSPLGVPSHRHDWPGLNSVFKSDWLDGALCLYRWEAVESTRLDERYFLYFEELDLHIQLRTQGWQVAVDTRARASQSTHGMPQFYAARNFRLLQRRLGNGPVLRAVAVTVWTAGRLIGMALRADRRGMTEFARGLLVRLPLHDQSAVVRGAQPDADA